MLPIIGVGLIVFGLIVAYTAEAQFRRSSTTVDHLGTATTLVTDGWFTYSRNPMYLSFALILIGVWLSLGSVSALLIVVAFIFFAEQWYILPEEKRLAALFGRQYETYRTRTRRWL